MPIQSFFARASKQEGSMLMVVAVMGSVLLMMAATTLYSVKGGAKVSGMEREDLQDINAAEAGIILTQNRINQAVALCDGFFSYKDSMAVRAVMVNTVYTLPSRYDTGAHAAVRISDFSVEPGRPMRIHFVSTGGQYKNSKFDSSSSHKLNASVRMRTLADYSIFSNSKIWIGGNVIVSGKVHADIVDIVDNTTFKDRVSYLSALHYSNDGVNYNSPTNIIFEKGTKQITSNPITLTKMNLTNQPTNNTCGARTYSELARGLVPNEKAGFFDLGTTAIYLNLNNIVLASNGTLTATFYYGAGSSTNHSAKGGSCGSGCTQTTNISNFNGIFYSEADIYVEGTLKDISLTIVSEGNMYVAGNVLAVGQELKTPDNRVTIGMITNGSLKFWQGGPTSLTVEAMIIAPHGNWTAEGDQYTHLGVDLNGSACAATTNSNCWNLRIFGGSAIDAVASSGIWFSMGGKRKYDYDADLAYTPPPRFPVLYGTGGAVPMWEVTTWSEGI